MSEFINIQQMEQKIGAAAVYHDLERDIYYLMDKQTGRLQRSHKNGSLLKSFKLDISGSDYRKRREQQRSSYRKNVKKVSDHKLQPAQVASEKFFSPYVPANNGKEADLEPIRARSIMNSERLKSHESEANFLTSLNPHTESGAEVSRYNHITSILKHFSKIKEEKVHENHCSLDKPSGTIINRILTNSRGFRETKNTIYQPMPLKRTKNQQVRVASQQSEESKINWGRQLSKQKKLFLQFHPNFEERENSRLLNEQIDRKKNIKKLQELFLEQTSKQTDKIYS